jgi:hypothetical protein
VRKRITAVLPIMVVVVRTMILWIRLIGSVFVSKMSKHGVSPREDLVTTDAKHDENRLVVQEMATPLR